jgi:hypothetical protein
MFFAELIVYIALENGALATEKLQSSQPWATVEECLAMKNLALEVIAESEGSGGILKCQELK